MIERKRYCVFTNDNYLKILLPEHECSDIFSTRDNHESIFRKINTILINNKFIKGNIIDLGCWIGDNSIPWSMSINGVIYAIDPYYNNCGFVKEVMRLNNIKNIVVLQEVIADCVKVVSTNDNLYHATFQSNENGLNKLTSTSLDILYENKIIQSVDYIHLDVEGMESLVIKGADVLISENQPIITFEQHTYSDDYVGLSNHLKEKDYKVYLINEVLPGCNIDCRNFLALPNRLDSDEIKNLIIDVIKIDDILISI